MNRLGKLMASMLKIGCIGFGGGNALIPILEKEFVENGKMLTAEEYNSYVVMANITPGALPVEMATALGRHIAGYAGMILAPICIAIPGVLATVILVSLLAGVSGSLLHGVEYASVGIGMFIIYLLINYNKKILDQVPLKSMKIKRILVIGCVFFLTCGKEIRKLAGIDGIPIFDISTVNILYLAIFFIFYCFVDFTWVRGIIGTSISILFLLCTGKAELISSPSFLLGLRLLMAVLAVYAVWNNSRKLGKTKRIPLAKLGREELLWFSFLGLFCLPAIFLFQDAFSYIIQGLESTVVSFGGGEAYLTVAEGMFLTEDGLSTSQLYGQLLPVVNALPGSILCKMLSGCGYYLGLNASGSPLVGFAAALAGFAASVTASCAVLILLIYFYQKFEEVKVFTMLKKCIRPIVGGLLLSTAASLLYSCMTVAITDGWEKLPFFLLALFMVSLASLLKWKTKLPDIVLILAFGAATLGIFNFL